MLLRVESVLLRTPSSASLSADTASLISVTSEAEQQHKQHKQQAEQQTVTQTAPSARNLAFLPYTLFNCPLAPLQVQCGQHQVANT
jgi:hypothetical protein